MARRAEVHLGEEEEAVLEEIERGGEPSEGLKRRLLENSAARIIAKDPLFGKRRVGTIVQRGQRSLRLSDLPTIEEILDSVNHGA